VPIENYDIVGSYNNQRISSIDSERSVNLFEYLDPLGKKDKSLLSTSGLLNSDLTFPGAANGYRAQFVANLGSSQLMFVVIGANVYVINNAFTVTKINTSPLAQTTGYVGIDANNGGTDGHVQVIFVDGANGYIYDVVSAVWTKITDAAFPVAPNGPIDVCYLDGFFVVISANTNNFYLSSLNEGLIWSGTTSNISAANVVTSTFTTTDTSMFPTGAAVVVGNGTGALPSGITSGNTYYIINTGATTFQLASTLAMAIAPVPTPIVFGSGFSASPTIMNNGQLQEGAVTSHPGTLVACRTLHRRIFFFSQYFTEVWENSGLGSNLPFRRNNTALMEYGTAAIGSVATGFDKLFFLSQDRDGQGAVMEVVGTESIPVSTRALDYAIAQYAADPLTGVADARGFLIKENGLIFYRLNFTLANHTYVYGVTMSDEQNKRWHEEEMLDESRHVAQTHGYFYGVNYVGNYLTPELYSVDPSYNSNDGESIRRIRIGRPIMPPTSQRLRIDRFQLDLLQGQITEDQQTPQPVDITTESGFGLETESGVDIITEGATFVYDLTLAPLVYLSISKDGGQSFGYRLPAPMGNVGQRTFRTVWRKLGTTVRGQAFVPMIEFFTQTPFIILGATWFYEVLPE